VKPAAKLKLAFCNPQLTSVFCTFCQSSLVSINICFVYDQRTLRIDKKKITTTENDFSPHETPPPICFRKITTEWTLLPTEQEKKREEYQANQLFHFSL
jgi:hypothetical protein